MPVLAEAGTGRIVHGEGLTGIGPKSDRPQRTTLNNLKVLTVERRRRSPNKAFRSFHRQSKVSGYYNIYSRTSA